MRLLHHAQRVACRFLSLALCVGLAACSPSKPAIQNKGSDTMIEVAQAWAEAYSQSHKDASVEVSGGGSGVGIASLIDGTVDIANCSRAMSASEMESAKQKRGKDPVLHVVGYDALAVYVHKDNPLEEITFEQLALIFAEGGADEKWSQLGVTIPGATDDGIVRVSRQSSSGTYEFFREHVLGTKDFKLGSRDMNGSKEVVELIASTRTAIGYSGMGYATPEVKMLRVARTSGEPAVAPSVANTQNHSYPLARPLYVYTLGAPEGEVKRYIDWMLSPAGQHLVEESGYVPVAAPASGS